MKKSLSLTILFVAAAFIFSQSLFSNRAGAPIARTGSPFDNSGVSCNAGGCHTGSPVVQETGWITSTIPGAGYTPGNTYTITATATSGSLVRFGFEISAQTSTGLQAGTNIITDVTNTRLAGAANPKYVTHTTTGSNAATTPGSKTWSYNWTAPLSGTGTVTFFGAFNCTNNSNSTAGDVVHLSSLIVSEDITGSWTSAADESYSFDIYPNPASEQITLSLIPKQSMKYTAQLVDVNGRAVKYLLTDEVISGSEKTLLLNVEDVEPGIYFLMLRSEESAAAKRIIIL